MAEYGILYQDEMVRALRRPGLCRVAVLDLVDGAVVERAP